MPTFDALVFLDGSAKPVIVFGQGRVRYHAIVADSSAVRLITLDSLRALVPAMRAGKPYPARRAASFYLNHGFRPITKRARSVLRGLVKRKPRPPSAHESGR